MGAIGQGGSVQRCGKARSTRVRKCGKSSRYVGSSPSVFGRDANGSVQEHFESPNATFGDRPPVGQDLGFARNSRIVRRLVKGDAESFESLFLRGQCLHRLGAFIEI